MLVAAFIVNRELFISKDGRAFESRLVFLRLHSRVFRNDRTLRVLLPPGYGAAGNALERYPVLYLNDGQDLFDPHLSTFRRGGSYLLKEKMQALYARGAIRPILIVGVDNAGHRMRPNEYLPWPDSTLRPLMLNPHGTQYPDFMTDEVMPFIQAHFRVLTDASDTGVGGASYGALAAVYLVTRRPGRFGRLLVESPSVYPYNYALIRSIAKAPMLPQRISIGVGTNEEGGANCVPGQVGPEVQDVWTLSDALERRQRGTSTILLTVVDCARHRNADFGTRFPNAVTFLFGRPDEVPR
ncbi:MAG TPA: alpha/beta hydrolase-fold protein [Candidatus Binatia bacterium]|nr:alpha/beta hydrolase-fold protein [Candidatus Binatia bacterium]